MTWIKDIGESYDNFEKVWTSEITIREITEIALTSEVKERSYGREYFISWQAGL